MARPWLAPQAEIGAAELAHGQRMLLFDGVCSQVMGVLTGGAFLVAFAVLLGATDLVIGLIAAAGPLSQTLQIPAIYLVEVGRRRKAVVVACSFLGRLFWILIAVAAITLPAGVRVPFLLAAIFMFYAFSTISGLAFHSWMRDLIDDDIRGSFMGRRLAISTAVGAALGLVAGYGVDHFGREHQIGVYALYFTIGGLAGLLGTAFLARIPEPSMGPSSRFDLIAVLREPLRDRNFRQLLVFLGSWSFAVNLATPFFTVYMLRRLEIEMRYIVALAVLSQVANVLFFRVWGRLADRFSNKSVLIEAGPMLILTMAIWPFTTMPGRYVLTIPLLILIHLLAGISTAGVKLCTGNIAVELSPHNKATSYLAVNSLVSGVAASIAPIVAGLLASRLADRELTMSFEWIAHGTGGHWILPTMSLRGLDFLFVMSFVCGLYALHRLLLVREDGEVAEHLIREELQSEVRRGVLHVSNVAGLRRMFYFPYSVLRDLTSSRGRRGPPA